MSQIDHLIAIIIKLVQNCQDAELLDLIYKLLLTEGS